MFLQTAEYRYDSRINEYILMLEEIYVNMRNIKYVYVLENGTKMPTPLACLATNQGNVYYVDLKDVREYMKK